MTAGSERTSKEAGSRHETAHGIVAAFVARHSVDLAAFNEWFDDCGYPQSDANVHDSRYLERLGEYVEERDGHRPVDAVMLEAVRPWLSLADLPHAAIEALRTRIAREWLAGYDDARRPDYDFADRLLAERGRHDGDCPHVAVPVAGACAGCSADHALAFADRALGLPRRSPELVPPAATDLPPGLSSLLADPGRKLDMDGIGRIIREISSLASMSRHDLLDRFLSSLDTSRVPTSLLGSFVAQTIHDRHGLPSWERAREAYWDRVAADARQARARPSGVAAPAS